MKNRGTKRKVGDDDELPDKRVSERMEEHQRSSSFQKPGPAFTKKAFSEQMQVRRQAGSSFQRPGPACSKNGSIDQKTTLVHQPAPSIEHSPDPFQGGSDGRRSEFIWLVQQFPHLYDPKDPSYRDRTKKNESWTVVGDVLGMTANDCQVHWKVLRDRYCREREKLPEHVADDFRELMKTHLKFLEPIVQHRKLVGNTSVLDASIETDQSLESNFRDEGSHRGVAIDPADLGPSTSTQSHLDYSDTRTSSSSRLRDRPPRILLSINKRNNVHQSSASISASPARSFVSTCSSGSSSTNAFTVRQKAFGVSPLSNADAETTFKRREELDHSSGYDGSSAEEDRYENADKKLSGVCQSAPSDSLNNDIATMSKNGNGRNGCRNGCSNIDQLFADTLLAVFRQFSPIEKNLILKADQVSYSLQPVLTYATYYPRNAKFLPISRGDKIEARRSWDEISKEFRTTVRGCKVMRKLMCASHDETLRVLIVGNAECISEEDMETFKFAVDSLS